MKIAVYAISKNEAAHVERFMVGVADADIVVVADTGSTDDTVGRLTSAGASVHEISVTPWRFDVARNMALDLVPADIDICFSIDLDEIPDPGWRSAIEAAWQPGVTRMSFDYVWRHLPDGTPRRAFRLSNLHARNGYRWHRAVHEHLVPTGSEHTVETSMRLVHFPDQSKSRSQYLPLLEKATRDDPNDAQISFWLAREYQSAQRPRDAIREFERYLSIPSATWLPERAGAWSRMGIAWRALNDLDRALECQRRASQEAPGEREPWVDLAQACHDRKLWQEGLEAAERALSITQQPRHYLVRDEAWNSRAADLASVCAWNLGRHGLARQHVMAALTVAPDDPRIQRNATFMGVVQAASGGRTDGPGHRETAEPDASTPVLVSVTMTGNASNLVGDAIASVVDWVDCCLVLDTGVTDETITIARDIAGDKLRVVAWTWTNDFAEARNTALDEAAKLGADWAIMVDTDERIIPGSALATLRESLRDTNATMLLVETVTGHYAKERFFRLPRQGEYVGPTHEAFVGTPRREQLAGIRFLEVSKTPEQLRAKFERDKSILTQHVEQHPDDPRWHYYLGDTLKNLGEHREAIACYERSLTLPGWDEQAAWSGYRAAECAIAIGDNDAAIDWCVRGLARHAGLAELAWLAAYASWQAGRPAQAVWWARMAIPNGALDANGHLPKRAGFRHPPALYEGPYDILRFALRAIGDEEGADEAERMHAHALTQRQSALGS
jgi:tetratricopeptide (TPR) repeat protein